jgi:hypothetical protein
MGYAPCVTCAARRWLSREAEPASAWPAKPSLVLLADPPSRRASAWHAEVSRHRRRMNSALLGIATPADFSTSMSSRDLRPHPATHSIDAPPPANIGELFQALENQFGQPIKGPSLSSPKFPKFL